MGVEAHWNPVRWEESDYRGYFALQKELWNLTKSRCLKGSGHFPTLPCSYKPIVEFIDAQFEAYLQEELKIRRVLHTYHDSRIHACLYFIAPTGHSLKSLDLVTMKKLDSKVRRQGRGWVGGGACWTPPGGLLCHTDARVRQRFCGIGILRFTPCPSIKMVLIAPAPESYALWCFPSTGHECALSCFLPWSLLGIKVDAGQMADFKSYYSYYQ